MSIFDKYDVTLTLTREMLGTNPVDPNILDTHILDRQRKLILEKGEINITVNKYLKAIQISAERGEQDLEKLFEKLETLMGYTLSPEERNQAIAGELLKLKETFQELDIKGTTVFFWDKVANLPCIGDHMILGYLKAASEALARTRTRKNGTMLQSISYTQSIINMHCRVEERFITSSKDIVRDEVGNPHYYQRSLRAETAQGPRISLAKSEHIPEGAEFKFTLKVLKDSPLTEAILKELFEYGELSGLGQWRNAGFGEFKYVMKKQ